MTTKCICGDEVQIIPAKVKDGEKFVECDLLRCETCKTIVVKKNENKYWSSDLPKKEGVHYYYGSLENDPLPKLHLVYVSKLSGKLKYIIDNTLFEGDVTKLDGKFRKVNLDDLCLPKLKDR